MASDLVIRIEISFFDDGLVLAYGPEAASSAYFRTMGVAVLAGAAYLNLQRAYAGLLL